MAWTTLATRVRQTFPRERPGPVMDYSARENRARRRASAMSGISRLLSDCGCRVAWVRDTVETSLAGRDCRDFIYPCNHGNYPPQLELVGMSKKPHFPGRWRQPFLDLQSAQALVTVSYDNG